VPYGNSKDVLINLLLLLLRARCANKSATGEFFYAVMHLFEYFWALS
jgi:hypothetical protein